MTVEQIIGNDPKLSQPFRLSFLQAGQDTVRRGLHLEQRNNGAISVSTLTAQGLLDSSVEIAYGMLSTGAFASTSKFAQVVIDNKDNWKLSTHSNRNFEASLSPDGTMHINREKLITLIQQLNKLHLSEGATVAAVAALRFGTIVHESVHTWVDNELDWITGVNAYWLAIENEYIANGYQARALSEAADRNFKVKLSTPSGDITETFNFTTYRNYTRRIPDGLTYHKYDDELMAKFRGGKESFESLIKDRYKSIKRISILSDDPKKIAEIADSNSRIDVKNASAWKNFAAVARDPEKLERVRAWFRNELSKLYSLQAPNGTGYNQKFDR